MDVEKKVVRSEKRMPNDKAAQQPMDGTVPNRLFRMPRKLQIIMELRVEHLQLEFGPTTRVTLAALPSLTSRLRASHLFRGLGRSR